jgi:phage terminase large subunit-like protein
MERLILDRKLEHNGNPVLGWQMGHAGVKTDANANKRLVKPDHADHKKIDGPVSGVMALAGARVAEQDDNWFKQGGGLTGDKFAY